MAAMLRLIAGMLRRDGSQADAVQVHAMLDHMNPNRLVEDRAVRPCGPIALGVISLGTRGAPLPAPARIHERSRRLIAADARIYRSADGFDAAVTGPGDDATFADAVAADSHGFARGLQGDVAAAIWDGEKLTLMRDHFGVRTLVWCDRPGHDFAFASLPGPLFDLGLVRRVVDAEVLEYCHIELCPPHSRTFFRDLRAVAPAHTVEVTPGHRPVARRYWRVPLRRLVPFDSDPDELARELGRHLERAVRRRIPPVGPLAGHLSGGLDSSSIAVIAARAVRNEGRVFHGYSQREVPQPDQPAYVDEAPWVDAVAEAESNINVVTVPHPGVYQTIAAGLDIDTMNPVCTADPYLSPIIHAAGCGAGVMFSGWGGDEFGSYGGRGAEAELLLHGRIRQLLRHLRARQALLGGTISGAFFNLALIRLLPFGLTRRARALIGDRARPWGFLPAHRRHRLMQMNALDAPDSRLNRREYAEAWWLGQKLTIFAQLGAPHGVATTYPLLDLDLVEYVMRIPGVMFRHAGGYRSLMRDATRGVLPESVRMREAKLMPYPLESLRMARDVRRLAPRLDALEMVPLVRQFVDIAKIRRFVATIEDPETVAAKTAEAAERGEQYCPPDSQHISALYLAEWLAEHADRLALDETT